MRNRRILILGGTHEARDLAGVLLAAGFEVISSLAGVTEHPVLPEGTVRRGGFGGVEGLSDYLVAERIAAIADATHPFAAQMSGHAVQAARTAGIPCLRLERPPWVSGAGDRWICVSSVAEAVASVPARTRPMVTAGRKEIGLFLARADVAGLARMIELPDFGVPGNWTVLLQRGPFTLAGETALMTQYAISHLVTKNAGGDDTSAKLAAARGLGLPVIMIARPAKPPVPSFARACELAAHLGELLSP